MAMDPKQERALRDGTASLADQPRDTDLESVREQAENPPVTERPKSRRRTAAVADIRVNQESGTPVDQMAREIGAEPIPEMGRAPRNKKYGDGTDGDLDSDRPDSQPAAETPRPMREAPAETAVAPREARRVLKARREHSKGDGNLPAPEPSAELLDERPEDRMPRDIPKSRDDRSAPKGNITAGQDDRNPNLQTSDDQRPGPPSRAFSLDAARDAAAMPNAAPKPRPIAEAKRAASTKGQVKDAPGRPEKAEKPLAERTPSMPKPKSPTVAKRTGTRPRATERTRAGTSRTGTRTGAPAAAARRTTAKRTAAKRAMPKRGGTKRAAMPRKRATAKRPTAKRASAKRPTAKRPTSRAKRPASRAKRKR
jgi:hypothetical protein